MNGAALHSSTRLSQSHGYFVVCPLENFRVAVLRARLISVTSPILGLFSISPLTSYIIPRWTVSFP